MKKLVILSSAASVLFMSGCASIFNDKTQVVNVAASNAKPLAGTVDGNAFSGPGTVAVLRNKNPKVFKVDTEGCAPTTTVDSSVAPIFFANIILGGFLGSLTDFSSDKMWKYSDNVVINCDAPNK